MKSLFSCVCVCKCVDNPCAVFVCLCVCEQGIEGGGSPKGSVEGGYLGSGVRSPLSAGVDSYRRWSKMRILLGRLPAHPARK